ncbi:hypothetical protein IFM89_014127 [Coptis chinensis]|uniref:non-specific serine/threonine protein kinase n=1 Tax=Coptis chinensis TaxID=261450 RepID=A0A835HUR3_9MAGN|nr:hypothetical protein IFM89_014127 [Coptis chinensis]
MPNGSLEQFIYKDKESSITPPLEWEKLYQIALGIARGLVYLHRGCNTRILHLDIKPHNILLDEDFCPKISDFGMAKFCPTRDISILSWFGARGTQGYIAPEVSFKNFGGVSHKSDVYSYGMMVLEMIGGRKNIDVTVENMSEIYFPQWIYNHLKPDFNIEGSSQMFEEETTKKMIIVALWCIQTHPTNRPSMSKVVEMLGGNNEELQMPPNPSHSSSFLTFVLVITGLNGILLVTSDNCSLPVYYPFQLEFLDGSIGDYGYPGFVIKCLDSRMVINISNHLSLVRDINYDYKTLQWIPVRRLVVPFLKTDSSYRSDSPYSALAQLKQGFELRWSTPIECQECESSGGLCQYNSTGFRRCNGKIGKFAQRIYPRNSTGQLMPKGNSTGRRMPKVTGKPIGLKVIIGVSTGVGVVVLLILLVLYRKIIFSVCSCWRNKVESSTNVEAVFLENYRKIISSLCSCWRNKAESSTKVEVFLENYECLGLQRYKYSDIKKMTNSFKDIVGKGGYGCVFKGQFRDGRLVAVKVLNESKGKGEDFVNEVATIGRTNHVNVVSLLGFCTEKTKRALVYEFMPNGSLEQFIYKDKESSIRPLLGWEKLYQIALGIARGLEYLHRGCNTRILHFDIKPHNILLDENFCPKISDFGMAKLCPTRDISILSWFGARGTPGYIAPEVSFRNFGGVSHKSDVYSYGMMVLEMIGGRKNIDATVENISEIYFPRWIYNHLKPDFNIEGSSEMFEEETTKKMIIVALWCIQTHPTNRPSISKGFIKQSNDVNFSQCQCLNGVLAETSSYCPEATNIRYPFRYQINDGAIVGDDGYPGLLIKCSEYPYRLFINISNHIYHVQRIYYEAKIVTVVDVDIEKEECPLPRRNVSLESIPSLHYYSKQANMNIFYNCTNIGNVEQALPCLENNNNNNNRNTSKRSYAFVRDNIPKGFNWYRNCEESVEVLFDAFYFDVSLNRNITQALKLGFPLSWSAPSDCEDCERSGGQCQYNSTGASRCHCNNGEFRDRICPQTHPGKTTGSKVMIGVSTGVGVLCFILLVIYGRTVSSSLYLVISHWRNGNKSPTNVEVFLENYRCLALQTYKYSDIKKMTNSFKDTLGQGGYGCVFKGKLCDGRLVAVKTTVPTSYAAVITVTR